MIYEPIERRRPADCQRFPIWKLRRRRPRWMVIAGDFLGFLLCLVIIVIFFAVMGE